MQETFSLKEYELIIFDCDGTLVDSEPISNRIIADMLREGGIMISDEDTFKKFRGTSIATILEFIKVETGQLPEYDFEKVYRAKMDKVFEKELMPIKGAKEFVDQVKCSMCIASNGPQRKMIKSLGITKMLHHFEHGNMFSAYDIQVWKPEPDLFLYAADKMGVSSENCVVIEDTIHGVEAAISARMDVFLYSKRPLENPVLDSSVKIFHDYDQLISN